MRRLCCTPSCACSTDWWDNACFAPFKAWQGLINGARRLALHSQRPYHWQTEVGEDQEREIIAPDRQNVWLCELGRSAMDGRFDDFVQRIVGAELSFRRLHVCYHSPSQGRLEFGWRGPLRQEGKEVALGGYSSYDNPYAQVGFPADDVVIRHDGHWLELDWQTGERRVSSFI